MLRKIKKSKYETDIGFFKLFDRNVNFLDDEKITIPIKTTFFKKIENIYRSTRYSFDWAFKLLHADIGNLEFLGKLTTGPKYCLLLVELMTSKVCLSHEVQKIHFKQNGNSFYKEVEGERKGKKTKL